MARDTVLEVLEGLLEEGSKPVAVPTDKPVAISQPVVESAPADPQRMQELGTYTGEQINSEIIFAGDGVNVSQFKHNTDPQYARKLAEAARFYKKLVQGKASMMQLREAMTSAEFSGLLGDTLDRVLLAQYATYQPTYRQFLRGRTARDFRTIGSVRRHGGKRLSLVPEHNTYPQGSVDESKYSYAVKKYGMTYALTWEMFINDDLEAFTSLPNDMADDAIQTEMYLASSLYVANTTLFNASHAVDGVNYSNKGTAALAIAALETAYNTMVKYPGDNGKPLNNAPIYLVTGPALALTATRILGDANVQWSGGDSTSGVKPIANTTINPLANRLTHIIDPYIPIIDTTNGHTSWYLFSNPAFIHGAEYAFLRGYEAPQIFMKQGNAVRMGGGGAMDGDFDSDVVGYKSRHVFGGSHANSAGGWRGCYWSDGTT